METAPLLGRATSLPVAAASKKKCGATCCITSKAGLVVLVWIFTFCLTYNFLYDPLTLSQLFFHDKPNNLGGLYLFDEVLLLFYPLAGFLADTKYGIHEVIRKSVYLAFILQLIISVIAVTIVCVWWASPSLVQPWAIIAPLVLLSIPMSVALVGLNANVIQFGMDQLHDSPADHQSLFIHWYVWVLFLSSLITQTPGVILSYDDSHSYEQLSWDYWIHWKIDDKLKGCISVISCVIFSVGFCVVGITIVMMHRRKHWFLNNIPKRLNNPYKLVYRVTRFACKHKRPIKRSAFTFCEDEIPRGLDLGKAKYGGPFSTEEVEDVKAFYGILKILLVLCLIFFLYPPMYLFEHSLFTHWNSSNNFSQESNEKNITDLAEYYLLRCGLISNILVLIIIPLYLGVLRPILINHIPTMLKRIGTGIILIMMHIGYSFGTFLYVEIIEKLRYDNNWTLFCIIYSLPSNKIHALKVGLVVELCLDAVSYVLIKVAQLEFICAQSPSSMKGLLIGLSFALEGLSKLFFWSFAAMIGDLSHCSFYCYAVCLLMGGTGFVLYSFTARRYKYRERDEVCNIHYYAEEYYSKTT